MRKPRFNRTAEFVFVKPYVLGKDPKTGEQIRCEPGDPIPLNLRVYRLRSLYDRGRIGIKGHPWTDAMIAGNTVREHIHRPDAVIKAEEGLEVANNVLKAALEAVEEAEALVAATDEEDKDALKEAQKQLKDATKEADKAEKAVTKAQTALEKAIAKAEADAQKKAEKEEAERKKAEEEAAAAKAAEEEAAAKAAEEAAAAQGDDDPITELEDGTFEVVVDGETLIAETREEAEALL